MWTKLSADKKSELMKAYKKGGFSYRDMIDDYNNSYEEFEKGGKVEFNSGGETHVVYKKESPTGNGKGIEGHIMINHPTKDKGKWDTIDLTDISNYKVKTIDQGIASTKKWHAENPEYKIGGIQKFQEGGIEESINKRLGNPMLKAEIDSDYKRPTVDPRTRRQHEAEPLDNVRHAAAGRYTQEAIENYANLIPYASAIPGFSKAAGFIGSNVLGLGHEASTLLNKNDDDTRTIGMKVKESAADAYNNMIGSVIGASNLTPYQKNAYIKYLSETGKMPTGQYNKKKDPTYKKEIGGIKRYEVGGETKPPIINMLLMEKQYNPSETSNQPVNDVYKKTYINTDPDIIGGKYWDYRNPQHDSEIENTLEYFPYVGSVLSVNDAMNAYKNAYENPGAGTYSYAALETLGMLPLGKGFNKRGEFITNATVQGMSDLAEYVQKPKTKKKNK